MPLKKLYWIFAAALLGMLGINAALFVVVQHSHANLAEAQAHRQKSLDLMYGLRQEIDRLNNLVLNYSATGEMRFLFYYYDILAIREGRKPAPADMGPSYWDRVIAGEIEHRMPGQGGMPHSLAQRMADLDFDAAELQVMKRVTDIGEEMKGMEQIAFASLQGLYDPARREFVSDGEPAPDHARQILSSRDYARARARLSGAVEEMAGLVDRRTAQEIEQARKYARGWIATALISLILTALLVTFVARTLRRRVLTPMAKLHENAMRLADGDYGARARIDEGVGEIADLGKTFDGMATSIEADIAQRETVQQELDYARRRAEQATQAKTMFLANMSHEIRTPMNAILGMTQLTLNTELTPQQRDYLEKSDVAARALLGIINDILDISKLESGKLTLERTPFDLEQVVSRALFMVQQRAQEKGLELLLDFQPACRGDETLPVGDPLRLGQVLINLLANAVKFTEMGHVRLSIACTARTGQRLGLSLAVEDTGIGMNEAQIVSLFQDFSQADASITRRYGGTGLGLSISRRLVGMMGGELAVASQPGRGARFHFDLDLSAVARPKSAMPILEPAHTRVLVVDDYAEARESLAELLAAQGFDQVDTAQGGGKAIEMIQAAEQDGRPYAMLWLDWRMPGMSGAEVLREVRARGLAMPARVLVVTAWDSATLAAEARALGATHVLDKPMLPSMLRRVLGPAEATAQSEDEAQDAALAGLHALVVEDNAVNRQIAEELLRRWGMHVDVAEDGLIALDKLAGQPAGHYSVVLMDVQMPVVDGIEATRRVRANARYAGLPIVAMTAHAMNDRRDQCLAAGMDDFLAKPFDSRELRACLDRYCRRDAGRSAASAASPASNDGSLPVSPRLDIDAALARLNHERGLYRQLLGMFVRDNADVLATLRGLLEAGRLAEMADIAHTLKGLAGSLGIVGLAVPALALEESARQAHSDVAERLSDLGDVLAPVLAELEGFFFTHGPAD